MKSEFGWIGIVFFFAAQGASFAQIEFRIPTDSFTTVPKSVFVAGSFNKWNTTATAMALIGTTWTARLQLPDGRHFYKFVWLNQRGKKNWMNDPTSAFMADNGMSGANNFVDVGGGVRLETIVGLEKFEWPPSPTRTVMARDNTGQSRPVVMRRETSPIPSRPTPPPLKWVSVAGDFNNWRLGQFAMVRCADGVWRAYIPIRRPFTYKIIADGLWHQDPGNEPLPTIAMSGPGGRPQLIPSTALCRVPDGYGRYNSYREQAHVTSPALTVIARSVLAGDPRDLDEITSHARSGDYGRAVALAQKVREANARTSGVTSTLVLQSLSLEAGIHKRWAHLDEAAKCWMAVMQSERDTSLTRQAANELAAYYLFVADNSPAARAILEWAMRRMRPSADSVAIIAKYATSTLRERRYDETLATVEFSMKALPAPDGKDKDYSCAVTELWLVKGYCHFHLNQWDKAREAFNKVIAIHPWADSQNVQKAQKWLGFVERRTIDPYDPL